MVTSRPRLRTVVLGLLALVLMGTLAAVPATAAALQRPDPVGSDPFQASRPYRGDFPDPTVWRSGNRFYAASTTVAALSLPITTSTDLRTWTAAPSGDPARATPYDGMSLPARWAQVRTTKSGRRWVATWAPSVARINPRRNQVYWVAAYAVPAASGKRCISLAFAHSPIGPFRDSSAGPLACGTYGAIDPQIFFDKGAYWLLLKVEGYPDRIYVRRLNNYASGFYPGSRYVPLLAPKLPWEADVVENPAMIRFHKKLYLFYSANHYGSTGYATGYAICKQVIGPCKRMGRLLGTGRYLAGPGGAAPFLDLRGHLMLAFHAWRTGHVGYPATDACLTSSAGCAQRRMYLAWLVRGRKGRLGLARYW
ncbi:MAG: family 43 glycosylhydrolase [Marmoricola sp.]|nr:family 43 glycosylhydrolase [Marmoricola sp.]